MNDINKGTLPDLSTLQEEDLKEYEIGHTQWKPGQTGNPGGRPRGALSLVDTLKQYLNDHPQERVNIIESLIKQAKLGNNQSIKEILDRIDGKVAETHRIEGELPIKIVFVPANSLETHQDTNQGALDTKKGDYALQGPREAKELPEASNETQTG